MNELNPFSTCFIQPGAIEYLEDANSARELAMQLLNDRRSFQIVGPHGSGKTSLTIAIGKQLHAHSLSCRWLTLRKSGWFSWPTTKFESYLQQETESNTGRQILFVDGVDALNLLQRIVTLYQYRSPTTQFVVTAHRKLLGYPVLAHIEPKLETFRKLALRLRPSQDPDWLSQIDLAFEKADGDFREAFFLLYDECR